MRCGGATTTWCWQPCTVCSRTAAGESRDRARSGEAEWVCPRVCLGGPQGCARSSAGSGAGEWICPPACLG
eukprot:2660679-Amphidinium_carterae.1